MPARRLSPRPLPLAGAMLSILAAWGCLPEPATAAEAGIVVRRLLADPPLCRAGRPVGITAAVVNDGPVDVDATVSLAVPAGVRMIEAAPAAPIRLERVAGERELRFVVEAEQGGPVEVVLEVAAASGTVVRRPLTIDFLPPLPVRKLDAVPLPAPVATDMLVGAFHCPLWESDRVDLWRGVRRHPERMPALGTYAQELPQVAEWEATWALEHGISFFVYCWYRDGEGAAVRTRYSRGLHEGFLGSRAAERMKFALLWENQDPDRGGVADERDLLENLLPFWITTYFKHAAYLKLDGSPVLFVYDVERFIADLGGAEPALRAVEAMRAACRAAGFPGLTLLGEDRGFVPAALDRMAALGLDASFAYCWHVPGSPTPEAAAARQLDLVRATRDRAVLPQVITVSQGWSGWHDEGTVWSIPPRRFEQLLRDAKAVAAALPEGQLGRRMILLDNWNEWGEGHFIAPCRAYGFGYLDAVRNVFAPTAAEHVDLLPEDVGLGPYDTAARAAEARREELRPLLTRRLVATGADAGLVARWTFDEPAGTPVAFDASGHRLGGELIDMQRAAGIVGSAVVCQGGVVLVPDDPQLSATEGLTVDCWVRTDVAGQHNRWIVNRVRGGGETTGYRLGLLDGRPCFEVPQTAWSHHLKAPGPLPTGRWVHLAGTFDGRVMRLFVDGVEVAALDRPGPVNPSHLDLTIGGFAPAAAANFQGLLDEVRLHARALAAEEIQAAWQAVARPAGGPPTAPGP